MKTAGCLIILLVALIACSTPSAPEYNELPAFLNEVSRGWSFFSDTNYELSATSFRKAIELNSDGDRAEAHIGLGWSLAMLDSLTKAISAFNTALARGPQTAEDSLLIYAGLSLAYRDITPPDFTAVRNYALLALQIDSNFALEYKRSINADDLRAVLAEAYFNLEQYTEAAAIADPDSTLDPTGADYHQQLLSKINVMLTISREGE